MEDINMYWMYWMRNREKSFQIFMQEDRMDTIRQWYDGYQFGKTEVYIQKL